MSAARYLKVTKLYSEVTTGDLFAPRYCFLSNGIRFSLAGGSEKSFLSCDTCWENQILWSENSSYTVAIALSGDQGVGGR